MNYTDEMVSDFYYTAVRMNTKVDYKTIKELFDNHVITSHRELIDVELFRKKDLKDMGISDNCIMKIEDWKEHRADIDVKCSEYIDIAEHNDIGVISCLDKDYPDNFKEHSGMPKVLFYRGNKDMISRIAVSGSVAVVGSRRASSYALYATENFCKDLSTKGITVISGMASGIDRRAHISSVDSNGGTVAILAGGADNIYPSENRDIYEKIIRKGVILSEMPPGQKPMKQYFPSRNRLIAAMSDCTLVMEAGVTSGTLHTASYAAVMGKEVFVLPNNIYYENAEGGLRLLGDGCHVLYDTNDVIDSVSQAIVNRTLANPEVIRAKFNNADLPEHTKAEDSAAYKNMIMTLKSKAENNPEEISDNEWKTMIIDELSVRPLDIDELCRKFKIPFYRISGFMVELQLGGRVTKSRGKYALTFN